MSRINYKSKNSSPRNLYALNVQQWEWELASLNAKPTSLNISTSNASFVVQSRFGHTLLNVLDTYKFPLPGYKVAAGAAAVVPAQGREQA